MLTLVSEMKQINNILQARDVKYKQLVDTEGVYTIFVNATADERKLDYQVIKVMIVPEEIEDGTVRQLVFYRTYYLHNNTKISEKFIGEKYLNYVKSYKDIDSAKIGVLEHLEDYKFNLDKDLILNFTIEENIEKAIQN